MHSKLPSITSFMLLSTALLQMVNAFATPEMVKSVARAEDVMSVDTNHNEVEFFFKGLHHDNGTGQDFHLWTLNDNVTETEAFAGYWEFVSNQEAAETGLETRGWKDCDDLPPFQTIACGTTYGVGSALKYVGGATLTYYFKKLMDQAFDGGRDNQSPRSECMSNGSEYVFCVSWDPYTTVELTDSQSNVMAKFTVGTCAPDNYSAEGELGLTNGKTVYICNSSRAKGCACCVC